MPAGGVRGRLACHATVEVNEITRRRALPSGHASAPLSADRRALAIAGGTCDAAGCARGESRGRDLC